MASTLLDYTLKVTVKTPIPAASTAFLRKAVVICRPLENAEAGKLTLCVSKEDIQSVTDNKDAAYLLQGGLSSVFVYTAEDLDIADMLEEGASAFFTVLVSSDFSESDLENLDVGGFKGTVGATFLTREKAAAFAARENRCAFWGQGTHGAKNMFFAFGKLLSSDPFQNQQYIEMPFSEEIQKLGMADTLFDQKVSFVLSDEEFGNRLAFFVSGGQAIIAPYIIEELKLKLQSKALQYINLNQPQYTIKEASLLEDALQGVIDQYTSRFIIEKGSVAVSLEEENFVASGSVIVSRPSALWRIRANLIQEV